MMSGHKFIFIPLVVPLIIASCNSEIPEGFPDRQQSETEKSGESVSPPMPGSFSPAPPVDQPTQLVSANYLGLTYQNPSGNRIIQGEGILPSQASINLDLPGKPVWIVGAPSASGSLWTVVLEDGKLLSYAIGDEGIEQIDLPSKVLPPGMPPAVISSSDGYSLVTVPEQNQSTSTHPISLPGSNLRVHININGDVLFTDLENQIVATLNVNALPDARLLFDEQDRILVFTDPTNRYPHGVLGDDLEAGSITLIETHPIPRIASVISLPDNEVAEGIAAIWADVTGDAQKEIIATISDVDHGAGIEVFSESGEILAAGPKMGQPYRWRHQIAFGPIGWGGNNELIVVRTPHIAGTVEYYEFKEDQLRLVAEFPGITSHILGSRNLDMAAAGDFDGDGAVELLLPNPQLTELIAVRRTQTSAEEVWRLPIQGRLSTNLAGVSLPDGKMALGIGIEDGILRFWLP